MFGSLRNALGIRALPQRFMLAAVLAVLCVLSLTPGASHAQVPPPPSALCTDGPGSEFDPAVPGTGLVTTVVTQVEALVDGVTGSLYATVVGSGNFVKAVRAAVIIYIAIYGILFIFGMTEMTLYDFGIRMIKIGIIAALLSGGSWGYFSTTVIHFFNNGTDSIIAAVSGITLLGVPIGGRPFELLDAAILQVLSARMAVTWLSMVFTGPYGPFFALLLALSIGSFIKALLDAIWIYLMSLVLRALLFGLAPIFISCILFNRTRHLFDGWLNQVVNACLQPILLFTFFAFFVQLILAAMNGLLTVPVCWASPDHIQGSPFSQHMWRFKLPVSGGGYQFYDGKWGWAGPEVNVPGESFPVFPVDVMSILIFLALTELASRFNKVVLLIATDLAGASTSLSGVGGSATSWFSSIMGARTNVGAITGGGGRGAPGRARGGVGGAPSGGSGLHDRGLERLAELNRSRGIAGAVPNLVNNLSNMTRRN